MHLVVGATGIVGSQICQKLIGRGERVRALVRATSDPGKIQGLRDLGAEIAIGDLRDEASLKRACEGAASVITTVSAMPFTYEAGVNDLSTTDLRGTLALLDTARKATISHFVYLSFSGGIAMDCPLTRTKRAVEAAVKDSGLTYTILRPSCFMEVWLGPATGFDYASGKATIYGTGESPISFIATADVAEYAVRSLSTPAAWNRTLELGGPDALSPRQVIRIFERLEGKRFEVQFVAEELLRNQQEATTDQMAQSFAALQRAVAAGDSVDTRLAVSIIATHRTTVEEYAERALGKVPIGTR